MMTSFQHIWIFPLVFHFVYIPVFVLKEKSKIAEIMSDEELSAEEALLKQQRKEKKELQVISI